MKSNKNQQKKKITVVIQIYKSAQDIIKLINEIFRLEEFFYIEIIIFEPESFRSNSEFRRKLSIKNKNVKVIKKIDRFLFFNEIKERILQSSSEFIAFIVADEHNSNHLKTALNKIINKNLDLVLASSPQLNFKKRNLFERRMFSLKLMNKIARYNLSENYSHVTDYFANFFVFRTHIFKRFISNIKVDRFIFIYEFLEISNGNLSIGEITLLSKSQLNIKSQIQLPILWDLLISILHSFSFRLLPHRAISYGLISVSGIFIQLFFTHIFMSIYDFNFNQAIIFSVLFGATSNYLLNNQLTYRDEGLIGWYLLKGLLKFLLVVSLPLSINIGMSSTFYKVVSDNTFWAQMVGIIISFLWNYLASSKLVWKTK
tara:strand:+ start:758 stop:1873 length:1116 start_codon:yes stop_codon:yes gene_type:complete